jgi:hypothetical protein
MPCMQGVAHLALPRCPLFADRQSIWGNDVRVIDFRGQAGRLRDGTMNLTTTSLKWLLRESSVKPERQSGSHRERPSLKGELRGF